MAEDRSNVTFLDLAGSKLRSRLSSGLNEAASAGVTSKFARRQLEKLGWKEGEGLGKRRDGISTHIRVQKRVDEQGGLGKSSVDENLQIGTEWWKDSVGDTLARLSSKKKKKGEKRKKTFTDAELFEATGGSRFGMRAQAPQKGKWQRTETIAAEEEQKAKESVEWNGMTAPQVILSEPKKKKRKVEAGGKEEVKAEKRKRKDEKKKRKEAKKKKKSEKKNKKEEDR